MLLTLLIISGVFSKLSNKNTFLDDVTLKEDSSSKSRMFAIMVENDDGEYEEYTDSDTFPTDMLFNEENSGCVDASGNTIDAKISYSDGYVSISTNDTVYCYLYFDVDNGWCVNNGITNLAECVLQSEHESDNVDDAVTYIKSKGTPDFSSTATTDEGLYYATDDYGDSYYFRGAVTDNYVYFAGFYWRIIRINGDGSIRMIYDGTSSHDNGDNSNDRWISGVSFNSSYNENKYVGYMYGDSNYEMIASSVLTIPLTGEYYFGEDYEFDATTGTYTLQYYEYSNWNGDGSLVNYYTCASDSYTGCTTMYYIESVSSSIEANVIEYFSVSTLSYSQTHANKTSSTIKLYLDSWYATNIYNKTDGTNSYDDYISDTLFCNDRSISSGTGIGKETTIYGFYERTTSPTLKCPNQDDAFTVKDKVIGNGALSYAVALITADEIVFAGGLIQYENQQYYLYTGGYFWTMTPDEFNDVAHVRYLYFNGNIANGMTYEVVQPNSVRPVINLSSSVILTSGDGTMNSPYEVSLQ